MSKTRPWWQSTRLDRPSHSRCSGIWRPRRDFLLGRQGIVLAGVRICTPKLFVLALGRQRRVFVNESGHGGASRHALWQHRSISTHTGRRRRAFVARAAVCKRQSATGAVSRGHFGSKTSESQPSTQSEFDACHAEAASQDTSVELVFVCSRNRRQVPPRAISRRMLAGYGLYSCA